MPLLLLLLLLLPEFATVGPANRRCRSIAARGAQQQLRRSTVRSSKCQEEAEHRLVWNMSVKNKPNAIITSLVQTFEEI